MKNHLDIEYWLNPTSIEAYNFITFFKPKLEGFKDFIAFSPKYKFQNLSKVYEEDFLKEHCFQKGEFCFVDNLQFNSESVLKEGLRQICLWEISQ